MLSSDVDALPQNVISRLHADGFYFLDAIAIMPGACRFSALRSVNKVRLGIGGSCAPQAEMQEFLADIYIHARGRILAGRQITIL